MKKSKKDSIQTKNFVYWALLNTITPIWWYFTYGNTDFFANYVGSLLLTVIIGFTFDFIQGLINRVSSKKAERDIVKYFLNATIIWIIILIMISILKYNTRQWYEENSDYLEKLEYNYKNQE